MRLATTLLSLTLAATVAGEQFWCEYDASCGQFPEQVGWQRSTYGGGDQRWFDGDLLVLDGSASTDTADDYWTLHPLNVTAGEQLLVQWRMRVHDVHGVFDPVVNLSAGPYGQVDLNYTAESIYSVYESLWIPFTPGQFHDYALTSSDLVNYELRVDGGLVHIGHFLAPIPPVGMTWGDGTIGASSVSTWDHIGFGVIAEPSSGLLVGLTCLCLIFRRTRLVRRTIS